MSINFSALLSAICIALLSISSCAMSKPNHFVKELMNMNESDYFSSIELVDLAHSIVTNDLQSIVQAIDSGVDVNSIGKMGMTPLFWAMSKQRFEAFELLLSKGANPNLGARINANNLTYTTPMELASVLEDSRYLAKLIESGGNVNQPIGESGGWQVLYKAVLHDREKNIALLVSHGADINHRNRSGNTVLMDAISGQSYRVALVLLELGADPTVKNNWGYNAHDIIEEFGGRGVNKSSEQYSYFLRLKDMLGVGGGAQSR